MDKKNGCSEQDHEQKLLPRASDLAAVSHVKFSATDNGHITVDADQDDAPDGSRPPPDGGYGWVVVASSFFSLGIVGGHFMSFGLLYPAISVHYNVPYGVSGWVGSFSQALMHLLGFVFSSLIKRFGCRVCSITGSLLISIGYITSALTTSVYQLYITYGLITGIGVGLVFLSNIVIVQQYFKKKRAMAAGLSNSGTSLGIMGMSLLVKYLLSEYGWKGTSLVVGGFCLHGVIAGCLLRPLKPQKSIAKEMHHKPLVHKVPLSTKIQENEHSCDVRSFVKDVFDFSLLKIPLFQLYCWATFCTNVGMMTFYMHTPNRALHFGVDPGLIGWLPSSTAIVTFIFRVIMSFVANLSCVSRISIYATGILMGGLLELAYILCESTVSIFMMCFATGATIGIHQTVQPTLLVDILGIEHIAKAQALLSLFMGAGSLIATPFAGFLYDVQQDYKIPFLVCGAIQTFGAFLSYIIYCVNRYKSTNN